VLSWGGLGAAITPGHVLSWDFQRVDLAVLGAVLEFRGSPILEPVLSEVCAVLGSWASSWLLLKPGRALLGLGCGAA
jgi:hypothetical protein